MSTTFRELLTRVDCPTLLEKLDLGPSEILDGLCTLACDLTGMDAAAVAMVLSKDIAVIGQHKMPATHFRRSIYNSSQYKNFLETNEPLSIFPNAPLFNGDIARFAYTARARVMIEGEMIGGFFVYNNKPQKLGDRDLQLTLTDFAGIAAEVVLSKASLKLMLKDVFSLASR